MLKEEVMGKITYLINFPEEFDENKKYPVIIFLHGAGSRGESTEKLRTNPYFKICAKHKNFPFITVAPLCSENTWFDMFESLKELVYHILQSGYADSKRVYGIGVSMGGYGMWQLGMSLPNVFAAIVPICGGGMYWNAVRLKDTPVWAFHGGADECVKCSESRKMVDAVNKNGGNARLTVYPENAHDSWSDTYKNYEVFEWLLSNTKSDKSSDIKDIYNDSKKFG